MNTKIECFSDQTLSVFLNKHEEIIIYSDGFVSGKGNFTFKGEFLENTSKTCQRITALDDDVKIELAPESYGNIIVLDVNERNEYVLLENSAFVWSKNVLIQNKICSHGNYEYSIASGKGLLALSAYGEIREQNLLNEEILFDDSHILGWEKSLHVETINLGNSEKDIHIVGNTLNASIQKCSLLGEDLLFKISGTGKVITCSRNKHFFKINKKELE